MKRVKLYLIAAAAILFVNIAYASSEEQAQSQGQSFTIPNAASDSAKRALTDMSLDELWDLGNTNYANSNFIGAERAYSEILNRNIHSAALYYNLGNVHHKKGELAVSLLYLYKALRLAPGDGDIKHNIEVVKSKTTDNIEAIPSLFLVEWSEWLGAQLSCMEWSILSLLLFAISLGVLLLYLLAESLRIRRVGFGLTLLFGVLFIVSTRYAIVGRSELLNPSEAVVMVNSMSVKSSPNSTSTELFIIHEGTKVEILTMHDTWCEIKLDDGKRGWVESNRLGRI